MGTHGDFLVCNNAAALLSPKNLALDPFAVEVVREHSERHMYVPVWREKETILATESGLQRQVL